MHSERTAAFAECYRVPSAALLREYHSPDYGTRGCDTSKHVQRES